MSRREEILDALIIKLRDKGLSSNFTISELAKAVDIGKSTIYEYFSTKDEILVQAVGKIFQDSIESIYSRGLEVHGSFEVVLKQELQFLFDITDSNKFLMDFMSPKFQNQVPMEHKEQFRSIIQGVARHYESRFQNIFKLGVVEGVVSNDNLEIKGTIIASLISGSILRNFNEQSQMFKPLDTNLYIEELYKAIIKIAN